MIHQLWGPLFDLVGNGGYHAFTFSWFYLKAANVVEMILVVVIFVVRHVHQPSWREDGAAEAPAMTGRARCFRAGTGRGAR